MLDSGETTNGIYLLRPQSANRLLQAWCEQTKAQGGWTVIQRRQDGSVNFFRTWEQYKVLSPPVCSEPLKVKRSRACYDINQCAITIAIQNTQ